MELFFLALLMILMATALGSGFPVAFSLPGSAILTIGIAALAGYLFAGNPDAYFAQGSAWNWLSAGVTNFRGVYWEAERDTLIAIPLFIFMGIMLQRSKLAEDLLVTMAQLFGPVPGGLGISVVFVGALLAATTGIVGATVVAMGLISLPAMMRNRYSNSLATGTIAASGTLGQIIPPSIVLIILADQLSSAVDQASTARKELYKAATHQFSMPSAFDISSTSAGEMFLGAFVPGLVLVGLYMVYILGASLWKPHLAPTVRHEGAFDRAFWFKVAITLVPPLTLIFLVLGSIITGVATVNQAGAIGAAGALVMAGYRLYEGRRHAYTPAIITLVSLFIIGAVVVTHPVNVKKLNTSEDVVALVIALIGVLALISALIWSGWRALKIEDTLHGVMVETAKTSALVFIILLGAAMLTAAFRAFGGEELVRNFLTTLPGGFWAQFTMVMLVIFILGFFLDFIEISVVVVPIVAPILLMDPAANVTAVWLGVMIGLNIQTSFLTPPFGFALFYLRGVAPPSVTTVQMYKGVIPFITLQLFALAIVGLTPQLVNYLPMRVTLTAETAPPPRNPALQNCVEEYVFGELKQKSGAIKSAITAARQIDLTSLPREMRSDLKGSFGAAEQTFDLIKRIETAGQAVDAYAVDYRPLHEQVRYVERRLSRHKTEEKKLKLTLRNLPKEPAYEAARQSATERLAELAADTKVLMAEIPDNWTKEHGKFAALKKTETNARRLYRRKVDDAYTVARDSIKVISSGEQLVPLTGRIGKIMKTAETNAEGAIEEIKALLQQVRAVPGTNPIAKELSDARRALRGSKPKVEDGLAKLAAADKALNAEIAWRKQAAQTVVPGLSRYESTIRDTIGLRQQPKLPKEAALSVAACEAVPPDLTLDF